MATARQAVPRSLTEQPSRWLSRLCPPADQDDVLARELESVADADWLRQFGTDPDGSEALAADPDCGPPAGSLGWLAGLPAELVAEYADAVAEPAVPEALPAGFLHRSGEHGHRFGAGGVADRLAPGGVLAGLAARAWADGLPALNDDELIGVLCAGRRLSAWSAALELAAADEVISRRDAYAAATGDTRPAEHVSDEVAAALTLTMRAADRLTDLAASLRRLPGTAAALRAGRIDLARAAVIADETTGLSAAHAAAVEQHILPAAPRMTTGQLRAAVRRAVIAADPAAARIRKEQARKEARVERWGEAAGTAALAGRDLPPAATLAADRNLTALARELKSAGMPGSMDNLRASVYLCLLSGQSPSSLLSTAVLSPTERSTVATPTAGPSGPAGDPGYRGTPGRGGPGNAAGPGLAGPGPAATPRPTSPWASSDSPIPPRSCSSWPGTAGRSPAEPGPAGPTGRGSAALTGPQTTGRNEQPAAWLTGPGLRGTVNLTMPLATWLGLSGDPGHAAGHGPLDADDARDLGSALAARPGSRWCVTLTDAGGHPVAHGCGTRPPPGGRPGRDGGYSRAGPGLGDRVKTFAVTALEADSCAHLRQGSGYRPPASLRHLIEVRQATCAFPGCRRPAARCDLDHTVAYERGGRTCECNLAPLCRSHHGTKQASGWHLEQSRPGVLTWTAPSGRSYTTGPTAYSGPQANSGHTMYPDPAG